MFDYLTVTVKRSETATFAGAVPPWELPVLSAVNGAENVEVTGRTPCRRAMPAADVEFDRMATKYGTDREGSGQSFVSLVYGVGERGIAAVEAEMAKCREHPDGAPAGDAEEVSDEDLRALGLFQDSPRMAEGAEAIVE